MLDVGYLPLKSKALTLTPKAPKHISKKRRTPSCGTAPSVRVELVEAPLTCCRFIVSIILGLYRDNGRESGNYYLGFRGIVSLK